MPFRGSRNSPSNPIAYPERWFHSDLEKRVRLRDHNAIAACLHSVFSYLVRWRGGDAGLPKILSVLRPDAEPDTSGEMRPAGDTANLAYRRCSAVDLINITV